jgi:hypothetical protein
LWHQIIFDLISLKQPAEKQFVPRNCLSCWKVVVKPRTLEQLFHLLELQKASGRPSKCGIEPRESVNGLYGGYFYNRSIDAGLECYYAVSEMMTADTVLAPLLDEVDDDGKTTRLILKRACTEFEHAVGPSDKWPEDYNSVSPEQAAIEDIVERWVATDDVVRAQPENVKWNVMRRWIEWAWMHGDPTYAKFTGGKPLYPPYVTYHPRKGA